MVKVVQSCKLVRDTGMSMLGRARCLQITILLLLLRKRVERERESSSERGCAPSGTQLSPDVDQN